MEDKVIFLLDKEKYTNKDVQDLTRKDLEKWIAEEDSRFPTAKVVSSCDICKWFNTF